MLPIIRTYARDRIELGELDAAHSPAWRRFDQATAAAVRAFLVAEAVMHRIEQTPN